MASSKERRSRDLSKPLQHYERVFYLKSRLEASSYKHEITNTLEVLFKSSMIIVVWGSAHGISYIWTR